jgi:hypothetical protein
MSESAVATTEVKSKKKKAKVEQVRLVIVTADGKNAIMVDPTTVSETIKANAGCMVWALGKRVTGITIIPGSMDVMSGKKCDDKLVVKYAN